jgi:hypothetical protein
MKLFYGACMIFIYLSSATLVWGNEKQDVITKEEDVRLLKVEHAESDARDAVARGDHRSLAVYGLTLEVPGLSENTNKLRSQYGLRILGGTSDALRGEQDRRMNLNARQYAERYNRVVVSEAK